jgi:hypothetical protein
MAEFRLRIDTSKDRAMEFVSRLAEDDDFRAELQADPRKVLWDYGVEVPDELIPSEVVLPPKEDVNALLAGDHDALGLFPVGPHMLFPVFVCFFAFPFLHAETDQSPS